MEKEKLFKFGNIQEKIEKVKRKLMIRDRIFLRGEADKVSDSRQSGVSVIVGGSI